MVFVSLAYFYLFINIIIINGPISNLTTHQIDIIHYTLDVQCSKISLISDYKPTKQINNVTETTQQARNIFFIEKLLLFFCLLKEIESNRSMKSKSVLKSLSYVLYVYNT